MKYPGMGKAGACLLLGAFCMALGLASCKKEKNDAASCPSGVNPQGHLSYAAATGIYVFETHGGGKIQIDPAHGIKFFHKDYTGFFLEFWGDTSFNGQPRTSANHENLNGKHIKDRIGDRRTIIFPDSSKITFQTQGSKGPLLWVSLYDGAESHHIAVSCGVLEYSATSGSSVERDAAEADGEAGGIRFTSTGLQFFNSYKEDAPGNKIMNSVLLGEIYRANPSRVDDYYDDPSLGHT